MAAETRVPAGKTDGAESGQPQKLPAGQSDNAESGQPQKLPAGQPDNAESGQSQKLSAGRSDNAESRQPQKPPEKRFDNADVNRPEKARIVQPENVQAGKPDTAMAGRLEKAPAELKKKDFYFDLPQELIAQDPLEDRSSSRLLVLDKHTGAMSHHVFRDVESFLRPGDCLVLNNTKVIPARLLGEREGTGAHVEVLLLKRNAGDVWETLVKPGKKCRPGTRLIFGDGLLKARVLETVDEGNRLIQFEYSGVFEEVLDALGEMPLPPYITHKLQDKNRYQTVYAKYEGSAAAPTAGLHFTKELLKEIEAKGVRIAYVTLHVGLGTFRPVKEENVLDHHMHSEYFQIPEEAAEVINRTKAEGGRVICVGTTSCRTVESASDGNGKVRSGSGDTDIFIYPGYRFKVLDGLITNFHLPESTLVMLVSALAGRENVLKAYDEAIRERYRFFSFGDAMLVL